MWEVLPVCGKYFLYMVMLFVAKTTEALQQQELTVAWKTVAWKTAVAHACQLTG